MARKAAVYTVDIQRLVALRYVSEEVDHTTGEARYRPIGQLEDIITGIGRQCDTIGGFDVRPSLLRRMAMLDGLTAEKIARYYAMDIRQARRYMKKLLTIQDSIEWRLPWMTRESR